MAPALAGDQTGQEQSVSGTVSLPIAIAGDAQTLDQLLDLGDTDSLTFQSRSSLVLRFRARAENLTFEER